jgi:hypothetical protein
MPRATSRRLAHAWPVMGAWVTTRVLVLTGLATLRQARDHWAAGGGRAPVVDLFGWDAAFYRAIAAHGYGGVLKTGGLRFFPLYPLAGRVAGWMLPGVGTRFVLLAITWTAALGAMFVVRACARDWVDERAAERVVWLVALGPGALALVMGYAEALYLLLAAACLLTLTRDRIAAAAALGALAALTRPVGVLLALAFVAHALTRQGTTRWKTALAGLGPLAGLLAFLVWARADGPFGEPLRAQSRANLRGELVDPARAIWSALHDSLHGHRVGPILHVMWVAIAIALVVAAFRQLPPAPAVYAAAAIIAALTSRNLDSFERYLLAAFPLFVVAAALRVHRDVDRAVIALLGGALVGYSVLAFATAYIP